MTETFRLDHNATETFAKLQQAYKDSVLSETQFFRCFKAFSEGRESIEKEPRRGRLSSSRTTENVDRIRDLVRSDRCLTVSMIGEELNLTHTHVHQILTSDLEMRKSAQKWLAMEFLASKIIPLAPQPPYSPDLSPCTFSSSRD